MAYVKTDWKNRVVEKPRTFTIQENTDGTVTLIPAEGVIHEEGTPVAAGNMNKIEQGIVDAFTAIGSLNKESIGLGNVENYGIATQAQAEAGSVTNKYMTPQRVRQAIGSLGTKMARGTYTGDDTSDRLISTGFPPRFVIITCTSLGHRTYSCFPSGFTSIYGKSGVATSKNCVSPVSTGFRVSNVNSYDEPNDAGEVFEWVAFGD